MGKKKNTKVTNSHSMYQLQADICAALANPVRLHILDLLSNGEKTASELLEVLNVPKANLSQHLAVLKDAGIIQSRKEGLYQYMSLAIPKIKDACALVRGVLIERITHQEKANSDLIKELKSQR